MRASTYRIIGESEKENIHMLPPDAIDVNMLAPCGLNCVLCYRHLGKNPCPGCRARKDEPESYQHKCIMRACVLERGYFS